MRIGTKITLLSFSMVAVTIAGIQAETNESVSAMEQQTIEVETESKVVQNTGQELVRIREHSVQSAELINEINLAAKQQVRGAAGVTLTTTCECLRASAPSSSAEVSACGVAKPIYCAISNERNSKSLRPTQSIPT
jgi:hypothetical protein